MAKGRAQLESATKKVRKAEPVDRLVRGADRARRAAGVGPTFPIIGYDDLNVSQVQARIKELSKPEQRKVLTYERKHANRKSVVGALEKTLSELVGAFALPGNEVGDFVCPPPGRASPGGGAGHLTSPLVA